MLFTLIKKLLSRHTSMASKQTQQVEAIESSEAIKLEAGARSAIPILRKHLERFPDDILALNNLGCCLADIGDTAGASRLFELAFSLDDSYQPVVINHAKHLGENYKSKEAMPFLHQARIIDPEFSHVDAVFAGQSLNLGKPLLATRHTLRAWLSSFDNLRFANCHLFYCSYADISEARLAAEHRFWGETLRPIAPQKNDIIAPTLSAYSLPAKQEGKLRIGYWSPDLRNHSVRYFFRPLLENHDKEKFEVICYHDYPTADTQTEQIKACSDHFFPVSELPDQHLQQLILSHELDILVELAGQSSANRLNLLQERLATLQITGLGYPPTTGLASIDAKILDSHIADQDSPRYYTESPLILPSSFWCFDPKEETHINPEPPAVRNGFITFACVGNVAKINQPVLACWAKILQRVPDSRLLIRSISFNDPAAQDYIADTLKAAGIPLDRVDMHKPAGGKDFFDSYNAVDIILDTFPFNGGTTTCFATYMGVPVVSWAGKSLISRMGKSILTNLDMADWVVSNADDYVERAVAAASDIGFLAQFRSDTRTRLSKTALGNGALFAREFEAACAQRLVEKQQGLSQEPHRVEALPAIELVQRAYAVLRTGQTDAAKRIIDHCLKEYPNCGSAHILRTQDLTEKGQFIEAARYLSERISNFSSDDKVAVLINIARNYLQAGQPAEVRLAVEEAKQLASDDPYDRLQLQMLDAWLQVQAQTEPVTTHTTESIQPRHVDVRIICDDDSWFAAMRSHIETVCQLPAGLQLSIHQASEKRKHRLYATLVEQSDADVFVWIHKNITINNPDFFVDILNALENCDVLGFAGAREWNRMDWRLSAPENKLACFLAPSGEKIDTFEVQKMGTNRAMLVGGLSILDGSMIAMHRTVLDRLGKDAFDSLLDEGAALMEEDFSHQAHRAGMRLAVHQALGISMDWRIALANQHLGEARWHLAQRQEFDPFLPEKDDRTVISVPVNSAAEGLAVQRIFLEN